MIGRLEYPLCMFFKQMHWAWKNWHYRPSEEEDKWHRIVVHFAREIEDYLTKKAAKRGGLT